MALTTRALDVPNNQIDLSGDYIINVDKICLQANTFRIFLYSKNQPFF